jgi:hypothetical protein
VPSSSRIGARRRRTSLTRVECEQVRAAPPVVVRVDAARRTAGRGRKRREVLRACEVIEPHVKATSGPKNLDARVRAPHRSHQYSATNVRRSWDAARPSASTIRRAGASDPPGAYRNGNSAAEGPENDGCAKRWPKLPAAAAA